MCSVSVSSQAISASSSMYSVCAEYMLLLAEIAWLETLTEHICDSCSAEVIE